MTATALKNATGDVLDQALRDGAIAITRHDKPRAILLSLEEYESMQPEVEPAWLQTIKAEAWEMLEAMQSPEQRAGAELAFNATPEELGRAAVEAAQRNRGA